MAGTKGSSGRHKALGEIYEFHFYYRFEPGIDPPELKMVLDSIRASTGQKRREIIKAALLSGASEAWQAASTIESATVRSLVDDMFSDF